MKVKVKAVVEIPEVKNNSGKETPCKWFNACPTLVEILGFPEDFELSCAVCEKVFGNKECTREEMLEKIERLKEE